MKARIAMRHRANERPMVGGVWDNRSGMGRRANDDPSLDRINLCYGRERPNAHSA